MEYSMDGVYLVLPSKANVDAYAMPLEYNRPSYRSLRADQYRVDDQRRG